MCTVDQLPEDIKTIVQESLERERLNSLEVIDTAIAKVTGLRGAGLNNRSVSNTITRLEEAKFWLTNNK